MTFFSAYIGGKTSHAVNDAVNAIVAHDPTGATEAQLKMMEQDLDKAGQALAAAHQQFDHDSAEQRTIVELQHQRMAAAEYLQTQLNETTDPAKTAKLTESLTTMMDMLEHMVPEVKHATEQAASAQEFLTMLQGAYETKGQQLKAARDGLQEAQRDMARSAQEKVIADHRAEAEAANSKAHLLAPTQPEKDDPNIVAAMRAASGQGAAPTSLSERLAALKASQA